MKALLFILLLACSISGANGQEKKQPEKSSNTASKEITGTQEKPLFIQRVKTAEEKAEERQNAADAKENADIQWTALEISQHSLIANQETLKHTSRAAWAAIVAAGISIAVAFIAGFQLCMFRRQLILMGQTNKATRDAASAALAQAEAIKLAERAYVKISHVEPGIRNLVLDTGHFDVQFEIKNWGETPADVVDIHLEALTLEKGTPLPPRPKYTLKEDRAPVNAFLVRNEAIFLTPPKGHLRGPQFFGEIEDGDKVFYIFGYVDYRDKFGGEYRAGYARKFVPNAGYTEVRKSDTLSLGSEKIPNNNLIFVMEPNYNYDQERKNDDA